VREGRSEYDAAARLVDEMLELGRGAGDPVLLAEGHLYCGLVHRSLAYVAPVLWNLGHVEEAAARSDRRLDLAERVGGPVTRAQAWGMRSSLHLMRGEPDELRDWVQRTHAVSIDSNIEYWRTFSSVLSAWQQGHDGAAPMALEGVAELCDWFGAECELPDVVRARRLLAPEPGG
jgi:hypothetical protein